MRKKGLEPSRLSTQEPKSCTSANSVISANKPHKNLNLTFLPIPSQPLRNKFYYTLPVLFLSRNENFAPHRLQSFAHSNRILFSLSFEIKETTGNFPKISVKSAETFC